MHPNPMSNQHTPEPERKSSTVISYTAELTQKEKKACIAYSRVLGFDFDKPSGYRLVVRLLEEHGKSAIESALKYAEENNE